MHTLDCCDVSRICWASEILRRADTKSHTKSTIVIVSSESGWQSPFHWPHSQMYSIVQYIQLFGCIPKINKLWSLAFCSGTALLLSMDFGWLFVLSTSFFPIFSFHFYSFVEQKTVRKVSFKFEFSWELVAFVFFVSQPPTNQIMFVNLIRWVPILKSTIYKCSNRMTIYQRTMTCQQTDEMLA